MKSAFLIAMIAVAMIGMMIPSISAEEKISMTIQTPKDVYAMGDLIILDINVDKHVMNSPITCELKDGSGNIVGTSGVYQTTENQLEVEVRINKKPLDMDSRVKFGTLSEDVNKNIDLFKEHADNMSGIYDITCKYFEEESSTINIKSKINPTIEFVLQNHMLDEFDVGTATMKEMKTSFQEWSPYCETEFIIHRTLSEVKFGVCYSHEPIDEHYKLLKILDNVSITDPVWGNHGGTKWCQDEFYKERHQCAVFNKVVEKIKEKGFPFTINSEKKSSVTESTTTVHENLKSTSSIASFVDQTKDPQHYIDRYNNESTYKEWFDENYSQYSSIYEAVGLEEPVVEPVVEYTSEPEYIPESTAEVTSTPNCGAGTESVNGICKVIQTTETSEGGGCLIATATYGSEMSNEVQQLRELRDNQLLQTESGTAFMSTFNDVYYSFSPVIADYERENPYFKEAVKLAITPMISSLSVLNYVDMDSENEVLGYGISLILLNLGMYLGVPAVVIVGIRKRF